MDVRSTGKQVKIKNKRPCVGTLRNTLEEGKQESKKNRMGEKTSSYLICQLCIDSLAPCHHKQTILPECCSKHRVPCEMYIYILIKIK